MDIRQEEAGYLGEEGHTWTSGKSLVTWGRKGRNRE